MASSIALVTGATAGIGKLTAERLSLHRPDWLLVRSGLSAGGLKPDALGSDQRTLAMPADLSSLAEVDRLVQSLIRVDGSVELLMLAAGTQAPDDTMRSVDGYERTFAVNVLANVALIDGLVAGGKAPRRVILFSSGTHNPDKHAGLPPPRHADPELLAFPERDPAAADDKPSTRGSRAYSASKLAITMLGYAFARNLPEVQVDSIDPQLTPGTDLARGQSSAIRFLWHRLLPIIVPFVPFMNRPEGVADAAVALALGHFGLPSGSGRYFEVLRGKAVEARSSTMSYDVAAQDRMLSGARQLIRDARGTG